MPAVWRSLITWVVCCGVLGSSAPSVAGPPRLAWRPRLPLEGSVVVLELSALATDSVTAVHGELAGEPLHFERTTRGLRALAAVPLGAGDSVAARATIEHPGGASDTVVAWTRARAAPGAARAVARGARAGAAARLAHGADAAGARAGGRGAPTGPRDAAAVARAVRAPPLERGDGSLRRGAGVQRRAAQPSSGRRFRRPAGRARSGGEPWRRRPGRRLIPERHHRAHRSRRGARHRIPASQPRPGRGRGHGRARPADRLRRGVGAGDRPAPPLARRVRPHHVRSVGAGRSGFRSAAAVRVSLSPVVTIV